MTRRLPWLVGALLGLAAISGTLVGTAVADSSWFATNKYDEQIAEANEKKAEQKRELEQLRADLRHMDKAIVQTYERVLDLEGKLPGLRRDLALARERLDAALLQQEIVAAKLEAAEAEDRAITRRIASDEARTEELRLILAELAREAYRSGGSFHGLDVVLGASSVEEFVTEYSLQNTAARAQSQALEEMEEIAAINRNRGARQEAVREYITELKVIADELVIEADLARSIAEDKKQQVDAMLVELRELKQQLEEQRAEARERQRELEADQKAIEKELQELIRKKLESERPANPTPIGIGHLAFPTAKPYITSRYGSRIHPIHGYRIHHNGTDFRAYCGTPIYASAGGRVEWARTSTRGYGNHVMLDHGFVNGNVVHTSYAHLTSFSVSAGQIVTQGQLVGYSGTTGTSTACHLHFEVFVNGKNVDPMSLLGPIP